MNPLVVMALIELGKVVVPVAIEVTPKILKAIQEAVENLTDDEKERTAPALQLMADAVGSSDTATA